MNIKNERIKKLWNSDVKDTMKIAKKLGLKDDTRIKEGIEWLRSRGEIQ